MKHTHFCYVCLQHDAEVADFMCTISLVGVRKGQIAQYFPRVDYVVGLCASCC